MILATISLEAFQQSKKQLDSGFYEIGSGDKVQFVELCDNGSEKWMDLQEFEDMHILAMADAHWQCEHFDDHLFAA